jgi:hypothetical protein
LVDGLVSSLRAIARGSARYVRKTDGGHPCKSSVTNPNYEPSKGHRFAQVAIRGQALMTTLFAQPEDALLSAEQRKQRPVNPDSSLSFTISLNADRRRIFHVLTISEYMETWLQIPERSKECPIQVTSDPSGFHVQYLDEKGNPMALVGAFQTYRTSKTNILWRKAGVRESDLSFVKIRLNGDFERTTLNLTHSGLNSAEEIHWHWQFWKRSLEKLSSIFELQ